MLILRGNVFTELLRNNRYTCHNINGHDKTSLTRDYKIGLYRRVSVRSLIFYISFQNKNEYEISKWKSMDVS
jgi:hypothetical protein